MAHGWGLKLGGLKIEVNTLFIFILFYCKIIHISEIWTLSALDACSSAILLMLDLSAAFDTLDHDILVSRLCNVYGIPGNALDWFRSYLTGRIQRVVIEDSVSVDQGLDFGVPQGSVLGPIMYCMYIKPVSASFSGMDCLITLMQMTHSYI